MFPRHKATRPGDGVPGPRHPNARSVSLLRYRTLPLGLSLARVELRIGRVLTGLLLVARQRLTALDRNLVIGLRACDQNLVIVLGRTLDAGHALVGGHLIAGSVLLGLRDVLLPFLLRFLRVVGDLARRFRFVAAATQEQCSQFPGGRLIPATGPLLHTWVVPGYEDSQGVFAHLSPGITCDDGTYNIVDITKIGRRKTACVDGTE